MGKSSSSSTALSWLSGASQAPDVFRAVIFALGDLDVGLQVGGHTSLALRTRLRAEIRRTWQQVDFLTLCRYILADRNTLGDPVLDYPQFRPRFNLSKDSALRCEDGIAAFIMIRPELILPSLLVQYFPDQVAQPRMHEFLLPCVQKTEQFHTDVLILLSNRYRKHLLTTDSFNLGNLEAHLYQTLDTETRDEYALAVTVKYGGTAGAIELLTFLCCHCVIRDVTKQAAVELVMELLDHLPLCEHRCLAYLFGSSDLWDAASIPKDKDSLRNISACLGTSRHHPYGPSSVRTLSDDREFNLALARTAVMLLSPHNNEFGWDFHWIKFIFGHLCQSPSPSLPDNDEGPDVICLIVDSAGLLRTMRCPKDYNYRRSEVGWGTAILAAIIRHLGRHLQNSATIHDGEQLFAALAHTEVKGPDGETRIWALGEWLRTQAPKILKDHPSSVQDVYDALGALYPLCEHNPELRATWDRIGYSVPPEELVYVRAFLRTGLVFHAPYTVL